MAKVTLQKTRRAAAGKRPIEIYERKKAERLNNPPVGLVTPDTNPDAGQKKKTYAYDPQLVWAGKAEARLIRGAAGVTARPRAHRSAHHHRAGQSSAGGVLRTGGQRRQVQGSEISR